MMISLLISFFLSFSLYATSIEELFDKKKEELGIENMAEVLSDVQLMKRAISARLGPILPGRTEESASWENSATTLEELLADAKKAAPFFLELTSLSCGSLYMGGHLFKEAESIAAKLEDRSAPCGIPKINDALRGSFMAKDDEDLLALIALFKEQLERYNIPYVFANLWDKDQLAYGAIHAKLHLPTGEGNRKILAEVQFHYKALYDLQESAHDLYKTLKPYRTRLPSTFPLLLDLAYLPAISKIYYSSDVKIRDRA
jgi:hypothetical protein